MQQGNFINAFLAQRRIH